VEPRYGVRVYLATAFCARLADEGVPVGAVLLALHRTGSPAQGAYALTAWTAPHLLAAPLTGSLAARARRVHAFYAVCLGAFGAAILGLSLLLGRVPLPAALAVALAGGVFGPIVSGGLSSLVAGLAPAGPERARAHALDAAVYNAASVAGPAMVTATAAAWSAAMALAALAGGAAVAALLVLAMPLSARAAEPAQARLSADLWRGLAVVRQNPVLRLVTGSSSLAYVGTGALSTTAVLLAARRGYSGGGGVLVAVFAAAALAGSLATARRQSAVPATLIACLSLLGTGMALFAAAVVQPFPVCAALFAAAGFCDGPLLAAILRVRGEQAPPGARTQVFTLAAGLKIFAGACGSAAAGAASHLNPAALLICIAALQCAAAAVIARSPHGWRAPRHPDASRVDDHDAADMTADAVHPS